jgi:DNA polymerase V
MNKSKLYGLVDCNNFYASCERVFRPKLRGKPVIVLSNNDGCVIARSNEAKKLGIQMAQPYFECEKIVKKHGVAVFSSNFALYGDFSARVMNILENFTTGLEIYSVDEAFMDLTNMPVDAVVHARTIRDTVRKWTGIPVSIGIGPTKTLAKLANKIAKKDPLHEGIFNITDHPRMDEILQTMDVGDIWGIGYRLRKFLHEYGITSILQLRDSDDEWIKKKLSVSGLRTVLELRGVSKIEMEEAPEAQKSILTSRSFRRAITELRPLKEAMAIFASRAAEKLREQDCVASYIQVFITTGYHQEGAMYRDSSGSELPHPTSSTPDFIAAAHGLLEKIFKWGYGYKKAGVILTGIVPERHQQLDLFTPLEEYRHKENLMKLMDDLNWRWGSDTIRYGASGLSQEWRFRQEKRSPNYTTQWKDLLTIKI